MRRLWACLLALALPSCLALLPQVRAWADTTVFSDACTEASTTALTAHTPTTVGTSWIELADNSGDTANGRCVGATDVADYAANDNGTTTPDSLMVYQADGTNFTDGYFQFDMPQVNDTTNDDFLGIPIRVQDASNYLGCGWYRSDVATDSYCFKVVAGTYTQLASGVCDWVDADVPRVTVTGDTITLTKAGVACGTPVSGTGANAIATAGDGGILMGNLRANADDVTANTPTMDNFLGVSQDAAPAGPPVGSLSLLGVGK